MLHLEGVPSVSESFLPQEDLKKLQSRSLWFLTKPHKLMIIINTI